MPITRPTQPDGARRNAIRMPRASLSSFVIGKETARALSSEGTESAERVSRPVAFISEDACGSTEYLPRWRMLLSRGQG